VGPSLLFIPDISGFTKFVTSTEVEHGRHIVAELLDLIIASDRLGLTVSELEGDAVFFYRAGALPDFDDLVAQARRTFEAFHAHLKTYEANRICDCGACSSAHGLSLKMVAHAGPVELISVRGFEKPYGPDVIVAHRLLKNDLRPAEYLLVTEAALAGSREPIAAPEWSELCTGSALVEDVGPVSYQWVPLAPLLDRLPDPPPPPTLEKSERPLVHEVFVDRAPEEVFELIANLDHRLLWNPGVDSLEYDRGRMNRVGTWHRCVIGGDLIEFETVSNDFGEGRLVYGELLPGNPIVDEHVNYFVVEPEGHGSRVRFEVHYRPKPFPRSLLAPLLRFRMGRIAPAALAALKEAAESRAERTGSGTEPTDLQNPKGTETLTRGTGSDPDDEVSSQLSAP
jgi:hypothetical protein